MVVVPRPERGLDALVGSFVRVRVHLVLQPADVELHLDQVYGPVVRDGVKFGVSALPCTPWLGCLDQCPARLSQDRTERGIVEVPGDPGQTPRDVLCTHQGT